MRTLTDDERRLLQKTVECARIAAEKAAREALVQRTVGDAKPGPHLDETGRRLRNKLRAHARQLGDQPLDDGTHTVDRLLSECAYAHWHRMLFARFLAENSLLLHPTEGHPIALDELDYWAGEWKCRSRWEAAERCAAPMLPQIFGASDLVLSVDLSTSAQKELEELLEKLPSEVFKTRDALGWVYQFWQSAEKERVNKSPEKIGANELPAVTQLFTEPYMVDFLLQNTLGAWWVGRHGRDTLPVEMPYLRFLEDGTPAAGTFETWPTTTKELKVLDPCCGSGHFLVAAFDLLVRFRMREEGLVPTVAAMAVLQDNLHGLELDPRCTQIAAFSLAFAAWTFPGVERYFDLPELHLACVGLRVRAERDTWLALANGNGKFRSGLDRLYTQFSNAPLLGSLIDPTRADIPMLEATFEELQPLLREALKGEKWSDNDDASEIGAAAQGLAKAASLLAGKYTLVCTNPPFLLRRKQQPSLLEYLKCNHGEAANDLGIAFADRVQIFCSKDGCCALVLPQSFIELRSYQHLRHRFLSTHKWGIVARLGPGAFKTISGEVVNVCMLIQELPKPHPEHLIQLIDTTNIQGTESKGSNIQSGSLVPVRQSVVLSNQEHRFSVIDTSHTQLSVFATACWGISPSDLPKFGRCFWEVPRIADSWIRWQSSFPKTMFYGGRNLILNYNRDLTEAIDSGKALLRSTDYWNRPAVIVTAMGELPSTLGTGEPVDTNVVAIVPLDTSHLSAIWSFSESGQFSTAVRKLYGGIKVTPGTFTQVPFDLAHWQAVAAEKYPNGLPPPHSDDPTQWLFKGDITTATRPLQVAVARLVGYRWPDQPEDPTLDKLVDDNGVVCLPKIRQEDPAADRLLALLVAAYGERWSPSLLGELLAREGAPQLTLESWLRNQFFKAHCELFHQRPFVWQVWDGLSNGFSALIHYHRLDRKTLESLLHADLGDWIQKQEEGVKAGTSGAEERLEAARALKRKLEVILEGESPYDIFVRWKRLEAQPIGWEPDLDDGVRLNIRPFVTANVLRTPAKGLKIKWDKDRGKDPSTAPWVAMFHGERINDHHLTLKEKREAREAMPKLYLTEEER